MKKLLSIFMLLSAFLIAQSIGPNSFDRVIKSHKVVLVEFWAPWCPGCAMLKPNFERAKREIGNKALLVEYNVDLAGEPLRRYHVDTIPTMILFVDGRVAEVSKSILSAQDIKDWVLGYVPQ